MLTKQQILQALATWIKQRPGLEFGNYGSLAPYRAELRQIAKDKRDAEHLLQAVALRDSITAADLTKAFSAYSGRLTLSEKAGAAHLDYCTGQYWPTEYRKAAAAVLASALWEWQRGCMPSKIIEGDQDYYPHADGSRNKQRAGDWLRSKFRREFGRSIQQRWFS
jgi:hypothetical protein